MRSSRRIYKTAWQTLKPSMRRAFSTNEASSTSRILRYMKPAIFAAGVVYSAYELVNKNTQHDVIDTSVLRDNSDKENIDLFVVDSLDLRASSKTITSGRSQGYQVSPVNKFVLPASDTYYYKQPFTRQGLLNELVYGGVGRFLMAETFPSVYAVETSMNDLQGRSKYSFLSENVGNDKTNKNLEEWVIRHNRNSEALIRPTSLGVALAFDLLFGKSDSKLANLVIIRHDKQGHHGTCYSIDNESCGNIPAMIMHNADDGFARIGEFAEKNFSENTLEQISNGLLDTTDNPHQPLKGSTQLLQDVRPILSQAIENDLNSGLITAFYERFAAMSDQDIKKIFDQYGDLLKQDERQHYIADIKARQSIVLQYLASIQVENNDKDNRLTLSRLT